MHLSFVAAELGCVASPSRVCRGAAPDPRIERLILSEALKTAARYEPEFARVPVDYEIDRGVEHVKIVMFPPIHPTGGFHLDVERKLDPARVPAAWALYGDSLNGAYHATVLRTTRSGSASIAFDVWKPEDVRTLAPIFQAALDGCLD
jgi:hypothetical protein